MTHSENKLEKYKRILENDYYIQLAEEEVLSSTKPPQRDLIIEFTQTNEKIVGSDDKLQPSVFDVAEYILRKIGKITTMKLQKLVYYSQAWSLVWDETILFVEPIEAWKNGPVVRDLFYYHQGQYEIESVPIGNPKLLSDIQRETIDSVVNYYGKHSSQWLSDLTHYELPWKKTREGLKENIRGNQEIKLDLISDYYSSLPEES